MVNISRLPALLATLVSMVRVAATMVLSAALGSAPVQCGSSRGDADSALVRVEIVDGGAEDRTVVIATAELGKSAEAP